MTLSNFNKNGRGINHNTGSLTITDSTFIHNKGIAGIIYCINYANISIENSIFLNNSVSNTNSAGVIYNNYGNAFIINSSFANSSSKWSGVIYNSN